MEMNVILFLKGVVVSRRQEQSIDEHTVAIWLPAHRLLVEGDSRQIPSDQTSLSFLALWPNHRRGLPQSLWTLRQAQFLVPRFRHISLRWPSVNRRGSRPLERYVSRAIESVFRKSFLSPKWFDRGWRRMDQDGAPRSGSGNHAQSYWVACMSSFRPWHKCAVFRVSDVQLPSLGEIMVGGSIR